MSLIEYKITESLNGETKTHGVICLENLEQAKGAAIAMRGWVFGTLTVTGEDGTKAVQHGEGSDWTTN